MSVLTKNISYIKGVGPKRADVLRTELGIFSIEDLLYYAPRKYLDRSQFISISETTAGSLCTMQGKVTDTRTEFRKRQVFRATITDDTGAIDAIFFSGNHYHSQSFLPGENVILTGTIDIFRGTRQIVHPDYDFFDDDPHESLHAGRIIPLYKSSGVLTKTGLNSRGFRRIMNEALSSLNGIIHDPLPVEILHKYSLPFLFDAISNLHFPKSFSDISSARKRLAFDELFFLQYYFSISRAYSQKECARAIHSVDKTILQRFINNLPFKCTNDQLTAIEDIQNDLERTFPMSRMLQGDVGSGKTIVAISACLMVLPWGKQCAVMAPTEVLARQHYNTFKQLIPDGVTISLLTSHTHQKEKNQTITALEQGNIDILIGTHSIIENKIKFRDLGLVVIDEQHKFGVEQRALLHEKGESPDMLVMSATPIPRSLTLAVYGDLDLSVIREKPADRLTIKTLSLPESRESGLFRSIEKYIDEGRQCFYILPLIEESQNSDIESAINVFNRFKNEIFSHRRVGLLHGKLKAAEKEKIMKSFHDGETDILVSTTVIEVGIDVPNASVMVIHHPERFGLAQLHQLRGRVGRGSHQSFCVLHYPDNISHESLERILILEKINDGFEIAEEDLKRRGAGDFFGTRQHGESLILEFADLSTDYDLLVSAKNEAAFFASKVKNINIEISNLQNESLKMRRLTGSRLSRIISMIS